MDPQAVLTIQMLLAVAGMMLVLYDLITGDWPDE